MASSTRTSAREVQEFLGRSWPPKGADAELPKEEARHRFRLKATEQGYLNRSIPKRYGGSEQAPDEIRANIIREEFRKVHAPGDVAGIGTMMLVPTLLEKGEEWQKEKFVPPTIRGEIVWCQGYSEPGSGSDLASLKTRAELVGDEWVINGQKIWTTTAQNADYMFCLCRTEPEAPKHGGISYLLIPMKQPGVEVRPLRQMTGGADFNEVFLTDAKTPKDWIVGKRGEGWLVSRATLKHERNSIGAAATSTMMFAGLVHLAKTHEAERQALHRGPGDPPAAGGDRGLRPLPRVLGLSPAHAERTRREPGQPPADEQADLDQHRKRGRQARARRARRGRAARRAGRAKRS